ncbi:DEAD/DEAH box helicase [Cytophagales bacterium LB-30]|uniref:DEAD/DEAH box helicase n=1 Tax=Shiella aurantiaca TaxID=3058365 RepID=A0ABT8F3T0_9BACT|nr:DEAD/DEAH box helicase [Shiella aurantiaca]MDN4165117.1 DEAD/DEAH box helicase [Shiella aurantiaca]
MSLESLKLNKQIISAMKEMGMEQPREVQSAIMSRLIGGQDLVVIAPKDSGRTTGYLAGIIMRLKYAVEEAPRAIILAHSNEEVQAIATQARALAIHTDLRFMEALSGGGMEAQMNELADGTDVIIGTPDRIRALYLKLGLNVNRVISYVVDNAELVLKQGHLLPLREISRSLPKCQRMVFTTVYPPKLEVEMTPFLNYPYVVEIEEAIEKQIPVRQSFCYLVPNFKTKLNLIGHLLEDREVFDKVVIFANTRQTVGKLYQFLHAKFGDEMAWYQSADMEIPSLMNMEAFAFHSTYRIALVDNERNGEETAFEAPVHIHLDPPADIDLWLQRFVEEEEESSRLAFVLSTDLELIHVKELESAMGQKMEELEIPAEVKIEKTTGAKAVKKEEPKEDPTQGGAFTPKKASNVKEHNYKYKDKRKMAGKVSKRRNS